MALVQARNLPILKKGFIRTKKMKKNETVEKILMRFNFMGVSGEKQQKIFYKNLKITLMTGLYYFTQENFVIAEESTVS